MNEIAEVKSQLLKLSHRTPETIYDEAIKFIGIDTMSMMQLKVRLNQSKVIDHKKLIRSMTTKHK